MSKSRKIANPVDRVELIAVHQLRGNEGQIPGVPSNPRLIAEDRQRDLMDSRRSFPEFEKIRELIVYPLEDIFIVLCGNKNFEAGQKLGTQAFTCKVLREDIPVDRLQAYALMDNSEFGYYDWDRLTGEWDAKAIKAAHVELPDWFDDMKDYPVGDGREEVGGKGLAGFDEGKITTSTASKVILTMTTGDEDSFRDMEAQLRDVFGTDNTTDTVMEALRFCISNA